MKKQILFIAFFILAALASMTTAYGQAVHQSNPIPLGDCSDDPLHPVPGRAYTYGVDGTGTAFTWWATKDKDFITTTASTTTTNMASTMLKTTNPGELLATDLNYATAAPVAGGNTVSITWSSQILAGTSSGTASGGKTPTFVVVQAEDALTCTNNFKVYQIAPVVAFTVDILPMNTDGSVNGSYTASPTICFSRVESATYDPAAGNIIYNYGTNVLYYEVVATNFTDFWNTSFKITGLYDGQTADVDWSYTTGATAAYTNVATGIAGTGSGTTTIDVTGTASATVDPDTNTAEGVSIYVRLTIHNGDYEGVVDTPIALAVNATDSEGNEDKNNSDCTVPATGSNFEDVATETLTKRPEVTPLSPPSNPDVFVVPAP